MANNQNTDNLDYLEEDDASQAQRCRQEAAVTRLILSYVKKHPRWHYAADVCHATKAFQKYGIGMCYGEIRALIEVGELDEEMRDSKLYVRFNEEQS